MFTSILYYPPECHRTSCHTLCLELDGKSIEKADGLHERVGVIGNATKLKITLYTHQRQLLTGRPCMFVPHIQMPLSKR